MKLIKGNSTFRFLWDLLIVILVFVSLAIIPYQFSFLHKTTTAASVVLYIIDLIFFIDIGFNFRTSYRQNGLDITDPTEIKKNYLRGSFRIDILANFPFEIIFLIWADTFVLGSSLFLFGRFFRLFRVYRLFVILSRWQKQEWINSGYIRIIMFFSSVFLMIHLFSSGWFLSAYVDGFPGDSWAVLQGVDQADPQTQYLRSAYWAITTMTTVGYGDITPHRNVEYVLSIIVMMLGASMYAFIIGNVASLMSQLDSARVRYNSKVNAATQFLRARQVDPTLNTKVKQYFDYVWGQNRGADDNDFIRKLPKPLRLEVLQSLLKDLVEEIPLFRLSSPLIQNELIAVLSPQTYPPHSNIVHAGEQANEVHFLSSGTVGVYENMDEPPVAILETGDTFGDMSMLLNENRNVFVKSISYCEAFTLSKAEYERIKVTYPEFKHIIKQAANSRSEKITKLIERGVIL